jgi:Phospholipase_D-nuclease N-terminal
MAKRYGKQWSEMSRAQQVGVVALGIVQIALFLVATMDLARRPASLVRGRKRMWAPLLCVNFVGPVAYLLFGRVTSPGAIAVPAAGVTSNEVVSTSA